MSHIEIIYGDLHWLPVELKSEIFLILIAFSLTSINESLIVRMTNPLIINDPNEWFPRKRELTENQSPKDKSSRDYSFVIFFKKREIEYGRGNISNDSTSQIYRSRKGKVIINWSRPSRVASDFTLRRIRKEEEGKNVPYLLTLSLHTRIKTQLSGLVFFLVENH